jgi:hypothetical protein
MKTLRKLLLHLRHYAAAAEVRLWGLPFWRAEQRRGRLQDMLDNERNDDNDDEEQ